MSENIDDFDYDGYFRVVGFDPKYTLQKIKENDEGLYIKIKEGAEKLMTYAKDGVTIEDMMVQLVYELEKGKVKGERVEYRLYDYQFYVSDEMRKDRNCRLPAIHSFERFKFEEYRPIEGKIKVLNCDTIGETKDEEFINELERLACEGTEIPEEIINGINIGVDFATPYIKLKEEFEREMKEKVQKWLK